MINEELAAALNNCAFPTTINGTNGLSAGLGLTKREFFAALVFSAVAASPLMSGWDGCAKSSVHAAEALIRALEESNDQNK